jgi:molybdate transport system substrate-binding protein
VPEPLRIFAAGSLRSAFDALAAASPGAVELTYANARDLAQRITAGEPADVFASASAEHPQLLHEAELAGVPRAFATNRLVVAVRSASGARDVDVLAAAGSRVVIEVAGIPLGDYTRLMLLRMDEVSGPGFAARTMANVVAEEQVVDAVAARLLDGDADAGVLYAIELPPGASVAVMLVACATTAAASPGRAAAWIAELTAPAAQAVLRDAGFGPPSPGGA